MVAFHHISEWVGRALILKRKDKCNIWSIRELGMEPISSSTSICRYWLVCANDWTQAWTLAFAHTGLYVPMIKPKLGLYPLHILACMRQSLNPSLDSCICTYWLVCANGWTQAWSVPFAHTGLYVPMVEPKLEVFHLHILACMYQWLTPSLDSTLCTYWLVCANDWTQAWTLAFAHTGLYVPMIEPKLEVFPLHILACMCQWLTPILDSCICTYWLVCAND